jgi:imidazolonepropionase
VSGASQLLTCVPSPESLVGLVEGGSVAIGGERIIAAGPHATVAEQVDLSSAAVVDASGKVVAPGFVDSHTHLVFGGSRVREYAAAMTRSHERVRAMGIPTGIHATVEMTRAESIEQLLAGALDRLGRMLRAGTTTVESKSGYGLSTSEELKMLEVNRRLRSLQPVDLVSTFLGAHAVPHDTPRDRYIRTVIEEMIPRVAEEELAEFCDVACDEGYYTAEESRRILQAAGSVGLKLKIHTDQYSQIGGSALAADLKVTSADHLNHTDRATMRRLGERGVTGVVMPAIDFAVQHPRPFDALGMMEEGLPLALATDLCPGGWAESVQFVMMLACRVYHFTPEEALLAATVGGARALDLQGDRGSLQAGKLADLQIWNVPTFEDVIYRLGNNAVETVIKRGRVVAGGLMP